MLYNLTKGIACTIEEEKNNLKENNTYAGYIDFDEFEKIHGYFGFPDSVIVECNNNRENMRSNIDVYEKYNCGFVTVMKQGLLLEKRVKIAFLIKNNLFLIVKLKDENESTLEIFEEALQKYKVPVNIEKIIFAFFEKLISGDNKILESIGNRITALEENMLNEVPDNMINRQIFQYKKELLTYRDYYKQLIDIGEELQENENDIFSEDNLRYIRLFTDKVNRLHASVLSLTDMVIQLREVYEATLDINLNRIMKVFTVITTTFLPLTLIAGWYGMNFVYMPEIYWKYGYLFVIILGIAVVLSSIIYFKKKKFM